MTSQGSRKLLLIGWDAADWRVIHPLMDAGKMPNLQRLVERGVMANLATLHPVLSPMLWTSIATGKRPYQHGILGFTEPTADGAGVRPVSSLSRKTKAFWNILHQRGLRSHVIGWWPSTPVEPIDGVMVSNHYHRAAGPLDQPWPLLPGNVHPPRLAETLAELRFHPSELCEEQVLPFVPRAAEIDQDEDPRLGMVMRTLAECVSVHAAGTWAMEHEPWDVTAIYYDAIDHFCHGFMKYHPPRRPFLPERDYELYHGVVEAAYRFHDMMLGATLALAPDDVTVMLCSDHGFHPDHNRPVSIPNEPAGPAVEHRDFGVFLMAGPGIRRDELLHGASLLDVTPTLLTVLGLPVGEDMDGKPLLQAFEAPPEIETIPSWDAVAGDAATHASELRSDPLASQEAIEQLVQLGYIEKLDDDREKAVAQTRRELQYNLAQSYMDGDLHAEAVPILERLCAEAVHEHRYALRLAMCYRALGRIDALRRAVEMLHERRTAEAEAARAKLPEWQRLIESRRAERGEQSAGSEASDPAEAAGTPDLAELLSEAERRELRNLRASANLSVYDVEFLRGYVAAAAGEPEVALVHMLQAEKAEPRRPGLHIQIGETYLGLERHADAERAYEQALAIDAENPHAQLGMARSLLGRGRARAAAEHAMRSVSLLYQYPMAHFVLGQALARLRRYEAAADAFEVAVALNPNFERAHRRLAQLYERRFHDRAKAAQHRELAREIRAAERAPVEEAAPAPEPLVAQERVPADAKRSTTAAPHLVSFGASREAEAGEEFVTVVSGLPRTGTSMMMQMLAAGGLPILSDGKREADADNPRGYLEHEAATRLRQDASWLDQAAGQGVKIVAPLLPRLRGDQCYRVILLERDLDEVIASQAVMLARLERETSSLPPEQLRAAYAGQLAQVKRWLARQPNIATLIVQYRETLDAPGSVATAVDAFLGQGLDVGAMRAAVDRSLYRQRRSEEASEGAAAAGS